MKILVVYYSLDGNTKKAAEKIAEGLGADLMALEPVRDIPRKGPFKFLIGGAGASMKKGAKLKPYSHDVGNYDKIILGTPVWAGKPCTAVNRFFKDLKTPEKILGVFAFAGGGSVNCDNCLNIISRKTGPGRVYCIGLADWGNAKLAGKNDKMLEDYIIKLKEVIGDDRADA